MKNATLKKFLAIFIALQMIMTVFYSFISRVDATEALPFHEKEQFAFNAADILKWSAAVGAKRVQSTDVYNSLWPAIPTQITEEMVNNKSAVHITKDAYGVNGRHILNATDASLVRKITRIHTADPFYIADSLVNTLGVAKNDITINYTVKMISTYGVEGVTENFSVKNGKFLLSDSKISEYQNNEKTYNKALLETGKLESISGEVDGAVLSASAVISGNSEYAGAVYKLCLVGNGNYVNEWCLVRTTEPTPVVTPDPVVDPDPTPDPTPDPVVDPDPTPEKTPDDKKQFDTTMEYISDPSGKMNESGDTYLPPYYDNDINKKDVDVTVTIKSTTKEAIVATNGVSLTDDGKANSEGWYYPDLNDKTIIAKVYPFDNYDNTTNNGMVKETVKLTGAEGGEDTQEPSIKWTFRRVLVEEKENEDESVTVTITYNLPVDEDSIPDDWSPVYDEDGKTIHKIQKTIKKGEDYEKDVTVKQNGTDSTVTTPVKKVWPKDGDTNENDNNNNNLVEDDTVANKPIIQAGQAWGIIKFMAAIGLICFIVRNYIKIKE